MKYKVLSTKKINSSLKVQAWQNAIEVVEQEFISIKPVLSKEKFKALNDLIHSGIQCFVFTSYNAVTLLNKYLSTEGNGYIINGKFATLSGNTKKALRHATQLGKNIIADAEHASLLAKKIIELKIDELIFFCGNKRRGELPGILKDAGIKVHVLVVYETTETPVEITDEFDAILFFSPSGAESFFSVNTLSTQVVCFAIGKTTADSIRNYANNKIILSEFSGQESMIASVQNFFQNINYPE